MVIVKGKRISLVGVWCLVFFIQVLYLHVGTVATYMIAQHDVDQYKNNDDSTFRETQNS